MITLQTQEYNSEQLFQARLMILMTSYVIENICFMCNPMDSIVIIRIENQTIKRLSPIGHERTAAAHRMAIKIDIDSIQSEQQYSSVNEFKTKIIHRSLVLFSFSFYFHIHQPVRIPSPAIQYNESNRCQVKFQKSFSTTVHFN